MRRRGEDTVMDDRKVMLIKIAEIAVVSDSVVLKTTLGSCVGVILHDGESCTSGIAHILLPQRLRDDLAVGKYADTAIPNLLSRLLKQGVDKSKIRAYLTGGADMFCWSEDKRIATVGEKNIDAAKRILADLHIPIVFEETGGNCGRTVLFDNRGGTIHVKTLSGVPRRAGTA